MQEKTSALIGLHEPVINERVLIETIGEWNVLGFDRRSPAYLGHFWRGNTGLQLLTEHPKWGVISILTPCRATQGRFEFQVGEGMPVRTCCYTCVRNRLRRIGVSETPEPNDWIIYMLLDSAAYLHGPAPVELP